ncbi:MAG: PorT protein [Flavobacteriales bacterium]|nr:PorT protein [Flavobacteriales bacterium]|tara:strand:- start:7712 stop:8407 length:696 start_codon:yes stop_codon:yes gene_type:complete
MKKVLSILIFVSIAQNSWAQRHTVPLNLPNYDRKPVHFGFLLGINSMDFKITPRAIQADTLFILKSQDQKGFNLGIVSNFRLGRNTDLRFLPTLSFAERDINYTIEIDGDLEEIKKDIESTFIEFPVNFKFKSNRYNNGRAYVITGLKYNIDLASQKDIDDEGQELIKLKKSDLMYEVGFGVDFYLEYFKFSPELKATFGLVDMLVYDESIYTSSIQKMLTRGFTITLTFE